MSDDASDCEAAEQASSEEEGKVATEKTGALVLSWLVALAMLDLMMVGVRAGAEVTAFPSARFVIS